MRVEIKNRYDGKVILYGEYQSIKECLEKNRRADLCGADLYGANLSGANLCRANLSETNLRGANLSETNLYGANLCKANLCRANLCRADLCMANLCRADLSKAELCRANLSGANLCRANYNGEKLDKEPIQIAGLKYYIIIIKEQIKIGCELHKVSEWKKFTNKEILAMDGKEGLIWWKKYKKFILDANKLHKEE